MKKLSLLLLIILVMTGCDVKRFYTKDIDNILSNLLVKPNNLTNVSSIGYSYYLPKGLIRINDYNNNQTLYSNGSRYYLYVDIINYFYNTKPSYEKNDKAYLSEKFTYNNKDGYLEVNKEQQRYYIKMLYNNAKIETYALKKDLETTIINSAYILSSIKYNDIIIKNIIAQESLISKEQKINLFEMVDDDNNYVGYDNYVDIDNELPDEDNIPTNNQ